MKYLDLKHFDRARIKRAIRDAEAGTTGRIWVRFVPDTEVNALERAKAEFLRRRLHHSETHNGALVLVAPDAHKFAVIGDADLHERVGADFWQKLIDEMRPHFERSEYEPGVCLAVARIGDQLHLYFPA